MQKCIKMGYINASAEVHENKSVAGPDDLSPLIDDFKEFGISSGSEVCQQAMEHLFTGYLIEMMDLISKMRKLW